MSQHTAEALFCCCAVDIQWDEPVSTAVTTFRHCPPHAAAPDLLAALEELRDKSHLFGDESDNGDAIAGFEHLERLASRAIKKALPA